MNSPKPVLCGVWRDRPDIMDRAFNSIVKFVSGISISVDPRYPEDKKHILKLCQESGLPHHVYETVRTTGGEVRTVMMQESEKFAKQIGATWLVNLDADDHLEFDPDFKWNLDGFTVDDKPIPVWQILEHVGPITTPTKRLFRVGLNWKFHYPVHEIPYCEISSLQAAAPMYPGVRYIKQLDGDRAPDAYDRYVKMIDTWLLTNPDDDGYMLYYRAQCLQAASRFEEARPDYEDFIAKFPKSPLCYRAAMHVAMGVAERGASPKDIILLFLRVTEVDPTRQEGYRIIEKFAKQMADSLKTPDGALMKSTNLQG